ncbi:MAG: hypothetical protein JXQ79_06065 [Rhodobacteraceae bacterium]|nr:hypothetical protein [Paracoccaceae bacterium]
MSAALRLRSVSPAAQVAVAELRTRAITRYLVHNRQATAQVTSITEYEQTFVGQLACTISPGPSLASGVCSFRAEFTLDHRPISTADAGFAMMGLMP